MWTVYETLSAPLPDTFETQHGTSKKPCALERLLMKNRFVETSNVLRFRKSITAVEERGASETCLIVVDGLPGLGKTTTLQNWVAQNDSVYLRAKSSWTPNWMLAELLEVLQVPVPGSAQKKYKKALAELTHRFMSANTEKRTFGIVFDEADHISAKREILETIRDLSDMLEIPTILVGMGRINDNLKRFPQVASRVSQRVKFEQATIEDTRKMFDELCEVQVADDLLQFVHKITQGFNRELLDAISKVEKFGLRNPPEQGGITMFDMAGQPIVADRNTSRTIHVPNEV